jgi:hypothetical protein
LDWGGYTIFRKKSSNNKLNPMHHTLNLSDSFKMQDKAGSNATLKPPVLVKYEVVNAIFKHGKPYLPGEKIMLVETAAANFIRSGDIKPI